jgi:hypothetical protein
MLCEMPKHKCHSFITLTYSDKCLPKDKSISKPELQKFFKRFRKNTKSKIKYFACGEYGEHTKRAHYHIILFYDDSINDIKKAVEESWTFGMVDVGQVSPASIRYVLNYVKKQEVKKIGFNYVNKPFQIMSKGIGAGYVVENEKRLSELGYIQVKGIKYSIPRYFEKKSELIANKKKMLDETIERSERRKSIDEVDRSIREEPIRNEQIEKNILARKSLKKRSGV